MTVQRISGTLEDIVLDYAYGRVDDEEFVSGAEVVVPLDTKANIGLRYKVTNYSPVSLGDPVGVWDTIMTVKDLTTGKAIGSKPRSHSPTGVPVWPTNPPDEYAGTDLIQTPTIHKRHEFRIRLWATQNHGEAAPPESSW